ncbi:MAG: dephospho-CoA kinase [Vicingaceae bacterium]
MLNIGLTGGIGSGKSTIASIFKDLHIPVYQADQRAKELMQEDKSLIRGIISEFGPESYVDGKLNRRHLASIVFQNQVKLSQLNALVHPAVKMDYKTWANKQDAPYNIREAAILFESGSDKDCDYVIFVKAEESVRIERVMQRDGVDKLAVLARMKNQWDEGRKEKLADFVIRNNDNDDLVAQVGELHRKLLTLSAKK